MAGRSRQSSARPAPVQALVGFLRTEAGSGSVLLVGAVVALVWVNSPWSAGYTDLWHTELTVGVGDLSITHDLQHWVNDLLMTLFFFVVGLEVKRELVTGELRDPRAAALPVMAALGGVVAPALIYLAIQPGGDASRGWGVPMATDIAFAVGVLALIGRRASAGAKLFLLSIAVADDVFAIVVIALFYSEDVGPRWLLLSVAGVVLALAMRRWGVVRVPWYLVPGAMVWLGFSEAGVHPTLAGVLMGLLTPALPVEGRPVLEELEERLHPWSAFVVVPVFALANAGVDLRGGALGDALGSQVTWGVATGLVVGKVVGIVAVTLVALRLRLGALPGGMAVREVWPVAALAGIGFTVALFVSDLAFGSSALGDEAKVGIFVASIAAGLLGALLLRVIPAVEPRAGAAVMTGTAHHDDPRDDRVTITPYPDGPLIVRGDFVMVDADGTPIDPGRDSVALCRCGRSGTKPFCDGTHKKVGFVSGTSHRRVERDAG